MITRVLLSICLISIISCGSNPHTHPPTESEIRAHLPGTWHSRHHSSNIFIAAKASNQKTFHKNGTAEGFIRPRVSHSNVSIYEPSIQYKSRWSLSGNKIKIYDMRSIPSDYLNPNDVDHDEILAISSDKILYKDGPTGEIFTYHRGSLP